MITYLQAIVLGALQGITEMFPVSSLGHSIIIPSLLGWHIDQSAGYFLVFLVATHVATALVLIGFFYRDWVLVVTGFFRSLRERRIRREDTYARLAWLIIVATIPAGLLGYLLQDKLQRLFASPRIAAAVLALNGLLLFGAEALRRRRRGAVVSSPHADASIAKLGWLQSVKIGCAQALALIPGFSRTGSALAGGLSSGLDHGSAARFAFLLATPIILAAGILKLPLLIAARHQYPMGQILCGALVAAVAAYLSVRFLTRYFQTKTLKPFAIYCLCAGILASLIFFL